MMAVDGCLLDALRRSLPQAGLRQTWLPGLDLSLWLLDPRLDGNVQFTALLQDHPPYWAIAWPTGVALAQRIEREPEWIQGRTVLDFGSGSGVVALASARAGARQVTAYDSDPDARLAIACNAKLNGCRVQIPECLSASDRWDVVLVADVLYDLVNVHQVRALVAATEVAIVGDCRYRGAPDSSFELLGQQPGQMVPDFGDRQFESVQIYVKQGYTNPSTT